MDQLLVAYSVLDSSNNLDYLLWPQLALTKSYNVLSRFANSLVPSSSIDRSLPDNNKYYA